jgi:ElaB/YqjD/DUF883 family membrane-anchored ribosome-binding protein
MIDSPTAAATEDLKDKANRLKDHVGRTATLAKDVACEGIKSAKDSASAMYQAGVDQAGKMKDSTVGFVRENPFKTVVLAAGVGAIVGLLLARRR